MSNIGHHFFFFFGRPLFLSAFCQPSFHYFPFHNHHFYIAVILLILAAKGFSLASLLFSTPKDVKPCTEEGGIAEEETKEKTPLCIVPGEHLVTSEGMNRVLLPSEK